MAWQHLTPGKEPVPIVQEAGWASGPVWTGAENLAPPGFDPRTVQTVGSRYADYATRPLRCITDCYFKEYHPCCAGKLDRWEGSQKHNSYDIQKTYILKS